MNPSHSIETQSSDAVGCEVQELTLSQLIGQVYEKAPVAQRSQFLECLLRPLGVLALVAVADGIFAKIRFRSGWPDLHIRLEDAQNVQATDVVTLVNYVQQVSSQAVDGLAQVLAATPLMTSSAAAAMLVTLLVQRAHSRRADDN